MHTHSALTRMDGHAQARGQQRRKRRRIALWRRHCVMRAAKCVNVAAAASSENVDGRIVKF
jgi:hypothetical protein